MSQKLFALLAGINDYPKGVSSLRACHNDVHHVEEFLRSTYGDHLELHPLLLDHEASRPNIIEGFEKHLSKAQKGDVVFFYYSGHGSRQPSAMEFSNLARMDETLVCWDSRLRDGSGFDLADKELAVLVYNAAKNGAHVVVMADSCFSGTITRGPDDLRLGNAKFTPGKAEPRDLGSYLDGKYYKKDNLLIPLAPHIALSASTKFEQAFELPDHTGGVFTTTLLDVLKEKGTDITYTDLFRYTRMRIRRRADAQTPTFFPLGGFDPNTFFLNGKAMEAPKKVTVWFQEGEAGESGSWLINQGALDGIPTGREQAVKLEIFSGDKSVGKGSLDYVKPDNSSFNWDDPDTAPVVLPGMPAPALEAKLLFIPGDPMVVAWGTGPDDARQILDNVLKLGANIFLEKGATAAGFRAEYADGHYMLYRQSDEVMIQAAGNPDKNASAEWIANILRQIYKWDQLTRLQNPQTQMLPKDVEIQFVEMGEGGKEIVHEQNQIELEFFEPEDTRWMSGYFRGRNNTNRPVWVSAIILTDKYGFQEAGTLALDPGEGGINGKFFKMDHGAGNLEFGLKKGNDESLDLFKFVISTEPLDSFKVKQKNIGIGDIWPSRSAKGMRDFEEDIEESSKPREDWLTRVISLRCVRRTAEAGPREFQGAGGITIAAHPAFRAKVSLGTIRGDGKSGSPAETLASIFRGTDLQCINLLQPKGGKSLDFSSGTVLELSGIEGEESLRENPLRIQLDGTSPEDKLLALAFDGEHVLPVGLPYFGENGQGGIEISYIPDVSGDGAKSLGKALKMVFFRFTGRSDKQNKLCWVEYPAGGGAKRHEEGLSEKIAGAEKILLVIHGIIGDTELQAAGLANAKDAQGIAISSRCLVLTYDYENLSTPIEETARDLKTQLEALGFGRSGKKLSILAHSMGGLVSRWMIEKEGGDAFVSHLIMAGTPNGGSAFGELQDWLKPLNFFLGISLNFVRDLISPVTRLFSSYRDPKVPIFTLGQMKPDSPFMRNLNSGTGPPPLKYTILAGDSGQFRQEDGGLFARLITKIELAAGKLAYGDSPNDIAVSVEDILSVPGAEKLTLGCHHLNYFDHPVPLKALGEIGI